jgi:ABC-type polysaccharide/polyol phosphate export permease
LALWTTVRPALSRLVRFFHISLIEARSQNRASYLGILWAPLSTLIFTLMLALIFRQAEGIELRDFFLYVLAGYVLWKFIAATLTSSTTVIQKRFDFAVHNNLTLIGLFFKLLVDRLFAFGLDLLLLAFAVVLLRPEMVGPHLLLALPFIAGTALVSISAAYLVNLAVILIPDLDAMVGVAVRFMFFASPVFWGAEENMTGVRALLVDYNPVAYLLGAFRQVMGLSTLSPFTWLVTIGLSALICVAGLVAYRLSHAFVRNLK